MDIYKHTAVSFAVSALLQIAFKKIQISIACFLTCVLIDMDHILDYYLNHELREKLEYLRHPRRLLKFLLNEYYKSKPGHKVYKHLHNVELLIPVSILYILGIWSEIATGMLIGFILHLTMDALPLGHIGAVSLIYKMRNGFPKGSEIMKRRLSRIGKDVDKCESCGAYGETTYHKRHSWYTGFTKRGLSKTMILCDRCHDRVHREEDKKPA